MDNGPYGGPYGGGQFKRGRMVMLLRWPVLMEREWSCY